MQKKRAHKPTENPPREIPLGFELRHTLRGYKEIIFSISWSPDGRMIASADDSGYIQLWDTESGELGVTLRGVYGGRSGAWSPDGRTLAFGRRSGSIHLWDSQSGEPLLVLKGHNDRIDTIAWSPDGRTLASGSRDSNINLWDVAAGKLRRSIRTYSGWVSSVSWSPDGAVLASGGSNGTISVWEATTGKLLHKLEGNMGPVSSVMWSTDGETLASGIGDNICLWDGRKGHLKLTLEGHTGPVSSVAFAPNGYLLASKSHDNTVRLWRCGTWDNVAVLDESSLSNQTFEVLDYQTFGIREYQTLGVLAFHPRAPVLAALGEKNTVIRIWDLDFDIILSTPPVVRGSSYTNAKVVLVGESGVGKTGLGLRLAEKTWRPTESTHGMNVWTLHSEPGREVMLWDFAGQDEYRLVHQLFLNETNVALLLYDPTKSDDTFEGIEFWEKALKNAVSGDVQKILVAARTDVGGVRMTKGDIENYLKANGYLAHFPTSAEKDEGCDDLRAAIMEAIPWDRLPRTSSPEVFKRIKDFLGDVRQGNRILVRESDLRAEFNRQAGDKEAPTEAEFRTVIGHVETAGLIKRLSFGDFVLLKPELLNGYASDIVDAARRHPAGLGAVNKADVLDGRIRVKDEGGLSAADKIFMLHATVELFLRLGLALEQDGNLVFPSKFNRRMPPLVEDPVVEVEFSFEGPVENLYTTLVVKLYYGGVFRLKQLWKNAAEFLDGRGLVCGFQLLSRGDGQGTLKVFYAEGVSDNDKALFLKIVDDHFREKRVEVRRERLYRCPHCREPVRDRNAIHHALKQDVRDMPCLYCFKPFPLIDALEMLYRDDEKFLSQIAMMETNAEAGMVRGGGLVAAAAEVKTDDFKRWAGDVDLATVAVVFTDVLGSTTLNVEIGDERWRQVRESHFARARSLIKDGHGYLIKTIGDSIMAAFHSGSDALDFALALQHDTGSEVVKIRVGINVGTVEITSGDAFGQQVSMAARVEAKAQKGGIWVSDKVKEEVDTVRAERHQHLNWKRHPNKKIKGFTKRFTLWSVEERAAE